MKIEKFYSYIILLSLFLFLIYHFILNHYK